MKQEVIKLESRYKDVDSELNQIENKKYILSTNSNYITICKNPDDIIDSIDLEGGPMIRVGYTIQDKKIKSIKSIKSKYVIEFE